MILMKNIWKGKGTNNMNKVFKLTFNGLLTMFLLGVLVIPIASMGFMGVKPQQKDVLSAQDSKVKDMRIEQLEREVEYLKIELTDLRESTQSTELP